MEKEINSRIAAHEAKRAILNQNNPKESSLYQYHTDMIERFKASLPKPKFKLHMALEEACESCQ
jgi:hypothetical protein